MALVIFCGCTAHELRPIPGSTQFASRCKEGFYGTHSKGTFELLAKSERGWKVLWRGLTGYPLFAKDDLVLFASVTTDAGDVKTIVHVPEIGSVVVEEEVRAYKRKALGAAKSDDMIAGRVKWAVVDDEIVWSAPQAWPSTETVEVRIKFADLRAMAEEAAKKKKQRVFGENTFFE